MLKKTLFVAAVTGLVAGAALPVQITPADAAMTCREAAKLKHQGEPLKRIAYWRECRKAWRAWKTAHAA